MGLPLGERDAASLRRVAVEGDLRMRKPIQLALLLAVAAWIGLIFAAPYSRQAGWPGSSLIYLFFHQICHQLPERSFSLFGHPLAVCHRCLGIYLGFAAGLLLVGVRLRLWKALERQPRLLMLFWIPMAVDVFLLPNVWWSRFLTGWLAAFPVAYFVQRAAEQLFGSASENEIRARA